MTFASLPAGLAARLMLAFGFGFFLSMFTRAMSNIVKQPIQQELGLGEEAISLALGTAFFVAFALAQIPLGVILDRYDPRRVNAGMFLLAALGAVIMARSETVSGLSAGRVLMGIGFAAGLMGSLKAYSLWFPINRLATVNSVQFMIGVLGAWSSTKPVELLLRVMDWRSLYLLFAGITVIAALILVSVAPRHEGKHPGETLATQLRGLLSIYRDGYFWRVSPWMFLSMGISQGLGTLYVFSWLTDVTGFSVSDAASAVALVTLISVANYGLLGPLAERLGRRGVSPLAVPVVGQTVAMVMLSVLAAQFHAGAISQWTFWTIAAGSTTLIFAALAQAFPPHLIGRVYTAFNLLGFLSTAIGQWLVGWVLDMYPRTADGSAAPEGYQTAFLALLSLQLAGAGWFVIAGKLKVGQQTMLQKLAQD
jgi:MFS family permease